ncbi:MAG: hypothetical protein KC467_12880 [Marinomonas atlantica]|nr:hypothetical protein [Marinomonas atlantica]
MRNAIIVLENPWELDPTDAHRSSVLPFIEGIAKYHEDTRVYYANFYDKKSFQTALDILCKDNFDNIVVYVAAHGFKDKLAGTLKLSNALFLIGEKSKKFNISGVLLGSCFVGQNATLIEVFTESTRLRWCAGYASTTWWMEGTLIDCSILNRMLFMSAEEDFNSHDEIVKEFARGIEMFNFDNPVGTDEHKNPVSFRESIRLYTQPKGRGQRAKNSTDAVWEYLDDLYCDDEWDD